MTLAEIIETLENLDDDLTIYAATASEWNVSSGAMVGFSNEGYPPSDAIEMKYFLEVALAKDVLAVWREWRNGKEPTLLEKCEAVIYYAENDAYLPTQQIFIWSSQWLKRCFCTFASMRIVMNDKDALDAFGKKLIEEARDLSIMHWDKFISGEMKGSYAEAVHQMFSSFDK